MVSPRFLARRFALGVSLVVSLSAHAIAPFPLGEPRAFVAQSENANTSTKLYYVNYNDLFSPTNATFVAVNPSSAHGLLYNSIGFDETTGYIYAVVKGRPGGQSAQPGIVMGDLIRIGQNEEIEKVAYIQTGDARDSNAGAFDSAGNYYVWRANTVSNAANGGNHSAIYRVSLTDGSTTVVCNATEANSTWAADFVFAEGYFWSMNRDASKTGTSDNARLKRIDPSGGPGGCTSIEAYLPGVRLTSGQVAFGAAWRAFNGDLVFANNSGRTFHVPVTDFHVASSAALRTNLAAVTIVELAGQSSDQNDGTSIFSAEMLSPRVNIKKETSATSVPNPDDTITYTLTVSNIGAFPASNITVVDNIPSGIASWAWTCTGAYCPVYSGAGNINETISALPGGNEVVYTITATVDSTAPSTITNTAAAELPGGSTCGEDFSPPPCQSAAIVPPVPIVKIGKTATLSTYQAGGTVTYRVTAHNVGTLPADGTVIEDILPANEFSGAEWACTETGGATCASNFSGMVLNQTITSFPVGSTVTYTATATVVANPSSSITNTAKLAPQDGGVCAPANNLASCQTSLTLTLDDEGGGSGGGGSPTPQNPPVTSIPATSPLSLGVLLLLLLVGTAWHLGYGRR